MSARRRWLVAYDVRDDARLRRVHDIVRGYGDRLQYSVFLCDLTPVEKLALKTDLRDVVNQHQDSIAFIDLGEPDRPGSATIEFMGTSMALPRNGPAIV
jgi:CRISPR-associated protein Cas2